MKKQYILPKLTFIYHVYAEALHGCNLFTERIIAQITALNLRKLELKCAKVRIATGHILHGLHKSERHVERSRFAQGTDCRAN